MMIVRIRQIESFHPIPDRRYHILTYPQNNNGIVVAKFLVK